MVVDWPFLSGPAWTRCVHAIGDAETGRTLSARTLRPPRQSPPADAPRDAPIRGVVGPHDPYVPWLTLARPRDLCQGVEECPGALLARPPRDRIPPAPAYIEIVRPSGGRLRSPRHGLGSRAAGLDAPTYALRLRPKGEGTPEEGQGKARVAPRSGGPRWGHGWPHGPLSGAISAASGPTPDLEA
jgi:hypothetical protein